MAAQMTFVAPVCTCCASPRSLLPRPDLPGSLAVCPATGTLYRPEGQGYAPTTLPDLRAAVQPLSSVRIDLAEAGYA